MESGTHGPVRERLREKRQARSIPGSGALEHYNAGQVSGPLKETAHMKVEPAARQPKAWAPNRDAHLQCFSTTPPHSHPPKPNTKQTLSFHPLWTLTGPGPELQGSHWNEVCPPKLQTLHTQLLPSQTSRLASGTPHRMSAGPSLELRPTLRD